MPKYIIITPPDFQKISLPFFQEWYDDLMTNPPQCKCQLEITNNGVKSHCCLGRYSKVQGRLIDGADGGTTEGSKAYLAETNPSYPILKHSGKFPEDCAVKIDDCDVNSFSRLNDSLGFSMIEIAEVLNAFYCAEK